MCSPGEGANQRASPSIFFAPGAALALDDMVLDGDVEAGEVRFAVLQQEGGDAIG